MTLRDDGKRARGIHTHSDIAKRKPAEETRAEAETNHRSILDNLDRERQRQKMVETLRESEQRFRALFETMTEGVALHEVIYDERGTPVDYVILDANPSFEKHTGISRLNSIGKKATEVYGVETAPFLDSYALVADMGEPFQFETYFAPMRKHFTISVFSPCRGRFATLFSDVSKLRQWEQTLREREEQYRTLFESMTQGVFYQRADGVLIDVNAAALQMFGLAREEFIGKTFFDSTWDVIHEDGSPFSSEDQPSMVALRTGQPVGDTVAGVFNRQTKSYVWVVINAIPRFHPGETDPYQVFVTLHDMSYRKKAEEEREAAVEFLHLVNQSRTKEEMVREALAFVKRQSGCEAVGIRLKEGDDYPYYETSGFPKEFILAENRLCAVDQKGEMIRDSFGNPVLECMCGNVICGRFDPSRSFFTEQGSFWTNSTTELLAGTTETDRQARTRNRCNGEGYESVALIALCAGDEPLGLLQLNDCEKGHFTPEGIAQWERLAAYLAVALSKFRTEEEKEKLLTQLRQAQKMEAIGTLAGGIAHDFNNILAAILGHAEMAEVLNPEGTPTRHHLKQVLKATYRARDLVGHILTFSRPGDTQELRPLSIGPIIKETLKLMRATLPSTIQIRRSISNEAVAILGDPTQLHQVLLNLCTNAAHAMREKGGILEIRLAATDLDTETARTYGNLKEGSYVQLTVKDTGHGMDSATLERIFDPYFSTKEVGEGTGLGLAVVHGIVKRHEGAIMAHSEPGKGTVFDMLFPRIESEHKETALIRQPIPKGAECILFVDDEEALAELGQKMLCQLGYATTAKTSSLDALEIFRARPDTFDLIVTDMTMPQMTGVGLAKEILRIRPEIPIILCTGHSETITEEKAKAMGIRAFVMKPLSRRSLAQVVRKVLDQSHSRALHQ